VKLPAFALFERSLRVETRSLLTCLGRVGLLGIILLMLFSVQTTARAGWYGAPGLEFLERMVWINVVFITMAGFSYFASAITEEKEEMMLGLLRMTDLNPIAILLGKSTSRFVGALLLLLVQFPFILLAITLGGVGLPQIAAAYCTLLAYLFLLCNMALLCSVVFRNTATAAAVTLFLVVTFFWGHAWAAGIVGDVASGFRVNLHRGAWPHILKAIELWRQATPTAGLSGVFLTGFAGPVIGFQVVSNLVLGVISFLLSWLVFDLCTRTEKDSAPTRRWIFTRKGRNTRMPRYLAGSQAIMWKDFTFITGGKFGLLLKFLVVGLLVGVCNILQLESNSKITWEFEGGALIWVSLISTAVWMAVEASRVFKDEVRWKTLSSLMTLPVSVPELAYQKVIGALIGTLPLLAGFFLGLLLVPNKVGDFLNELNRDPEGFGVLAVVFLQYVFFLHLTAFLSLLIKRGALPLAVAIHVVGIIIFATFSVIIFAGFSGSSGGPIFLICFVSVVLTIPLHFGIGYRLERAAAQE
jgi:ABC-type transport system involved in multi-copper enzyme maturation permease subunit